MAQGIARDRNALWRVVHHVCEPDQRIFASPIPCTAVDLAAGYAIIKDPDPFAATHFLLVPTARITGIEDPELLSLHTPNYWAQAWQARQYIDQRAGRVLERNELSLAVNSMYGRTQDQLHIHIDCIKPAVRAALRVHAGAIGPAWKPFPVLLAGEPYLARRVTGSDLSDIDPFRLLAGRLEARAAMGAQSLVVTGEIGVDGQPGFILLAGRTSPEFGNKWGEALQDHRCAVTHSSDRQVLGPPSK